MLFTFSAIIQNTPSLLMLGILIYWQTTQFTWVVMIWKRKPRELMIRQRLSIGDLRLILTFRWKIFTKNLKPLFVQCLRNHKHMLTDLEQVKDSGWKLKFKMRSKQWRKLSAVGIAGTLTMS